MIVPTSSLKKLKLILCLIICKIIVVAVTGRPLSFVFVDVVSSSKTKKIFKHAQTFIGGGIGGGGGRKTFQRLTLCLWAVHGNNRLQMVLVPQSSRRGAALADIQQYNRMKSYYT